MMLLIRFPDGCRNIHPIVFQLSPFLWQGVLMACDGSRLARPLHARTVTKRKYPGICVLSGRPATACLRHEPFRSLHSLTMEVMAGLSLDTSTLRIRVSFYSAFKLQSRRIFLRAMLARGCVPLISQFKNCFSVKSIQRIF